MGPGGCGPLAWIAIFVVASSTCVEVFHNMAREVNPYQGWHRRGLPRALIVGKPRKTLAQYDWTTGAPDNGKEWRKFRAVPRLYPLRSLVFCRLFSRGGNRRAFRLRGAGGDHLHCTVEPSPGHIRRRKKTLKSSFMARVFYPEPRAHVLRSQGPPTEVKIGKSGKWHFWGQKMPFWGVPFGTI